MITFVKYTYLVLILTLLFFVITLPILIITFDAKKSFDVADNMFEKLIDYMICNK